MNEKVKPWMAVVLNPTEGEQQVFYFDDYLDTWTFAKKNPHKRIALGVAIMITGKAESVGLGFHNPVPYCPNCQSRAVSVVDDRLHCQGCGCEYPVAVTNASGLVQEDCLSCHSFHRYGNKCPACGKEPVVQQ